MAFADPVLSLGGFTGVGGAAAPFRFVTAGFFDLVGVVDALVRLEAGGS